MKAILFNDTSHYHSGCNAVMEYLLRDLKVNGYTVLQSVKCKEFPDYDPRVLKVADAVIINGEGTMHHDAPLAKWYLDLISKAYYLKKKIFLINMVWQEMTLSRKLKKILQESYVSVRDIKSQSALNRHNINAHLHLDLSYNHKVHWTYKGEREGLLLGSFSTAYDDRQKDIPSVSIFSDSWNDIIQKLSQAKYFITGRHHEMYAACIARCPFYVFKGNSWKNEGLLDTVACHLALGPQMPFPYDKEDQKVLDFMKGVEDASIFSQHMEEIEKAQPYYNQLFDWMEKQKPFSFADQRIHVPF